MNWSTLIPVFTFILGLLGKIFYDMWHDNYIENKQRQKDALKKHFADLEANAIKPISEIMRRITNSGGTLWEYRKTGAYDPSYNWPTKDFEQGQYAILKLHFPDLARTVTQLTNEVDKHNEDSQSFTNRLKELIEEKTGLTVRKGKERPFIHEHVPSYLRQTLHQLVKSESLTHDFRQATIEREGEFWRVRTTGTIYAEVTTEQEGNSCKNSLIELMESTALLEEMSDISERAKRIENESRSIADLLDFTCWEYRESEQLLAEEKDCPYCQVIFHPKKRSKLETI
jgi:hypothetical protein